MKTRLPLFFLLLIFLFTPIFLITRNILPDHKKIIKNEVEPLVYVTTYGKKYHSENCHYLERSKRTIGKQQALSKGYTACSHCKGLSSDVITVEYEIITPIDNTEKSLVISFCITFLFSVLLSLTLKKQIA